MRKDFELILMDRLDSSTASVRTNNGLLYYIFPQSKGFNYYITDSACSKLTRLERASRRQPVVTVIMRDFRNGMPDSIGISHTNFNFDIGLKKLKE